MSEEAKHVFKRMVIMFNVGDFNAISETVAETYVDHQELDYSDDGRETFRRVVQRVRQSFPDLKMSIEDLVSQADRVARRLSWVGTDASGRAFQAESFDIVHVAEGLAVEHWGASKGWPS